MFVIGVTGGIGSGKSTAAAMIGRWGMPVIDADTLSRDVTAAGGAALPELVERFGGRLLDAAGALKRADLADLIFADRVARDEVNRIVHTHVLRAIGEQIDQYRRKKEKALVLDVPLPVKEGFLDRAHFVIAVTAPDDLRVERLLKRGMAEGDARRRMAVQMPQEDYVRLADLEIKNDGDLEQLEARLRDALIPELSKRGVRLPGPDASDVEAK